MHQQEKKRILEKAGYMHVSGWLPIRKAKEVKRMIHDHAKQAAKAVEDQSED